MRDGVCREARAHDLDGGGATEHAGLRRRDRQIGEHRIELRADEARVDVQDRVHGRGVLRGERRHDARAVDPEGVERLQVRLKTRGASRIRARDGKRHRRHASALYPASAAVNAVAAPTPIR